MVADPSASERFVSDPPDQNQEQIAHWNGLAGERWVQHQAAIDRALQPFGEAALDRLRCSPGERILDVGCGAGETVLAIARRLGASGSVVGVDASRPLLARARERAQALGNVSFIEADASSCEFPSAFDAVFSRFGIMFFADPVLAFRNLRGTLERNGRLGFVCWQALADNAWCSIPLAAARQIVTEAPAAPVPGAPGPFAFADPRHIRRVLSAAGFSQIDVASFHAPVILSEEGLDAGIDFTLRIGPVARFIAEQSEQICQQVRQRLRSALASAATATTVTLDGAAWLVTARA
jgi:SAM-dependent methyltransferase